MRGFLGWSVWSIAGLWLIEKLTEFFDSVGATVWAADIFSVKVWVMKVPIPAATKNYLQIGGYYLRHFPD